MSDAGFFAQKRRSPTSLAVVVALHAAAFTALALAKGPQFIRPDFGPIVVTPIPLPDDPPPVPPQPRREPRESTVTRAPTPTERFRDLTDFDRDPFPQPPPPPPTGEGTRLARVEPITPTIRRQAELLSGDLQPPYPASEERAQRGGSVRLRVTIGADGRVTAVERLFATSDAFWRVTERQALTRWRFRPATEDGRPVAASRVMTVTFRIGDA